MYDILVYLFENYIHAEAAPEPKLLARKLSAVGFERQQIEHALAWLAAVHHLIENHQPVAPSRPDAVRIYSELEQQRLTPRCRGFLTFLETARLLTPISRELIIDCALSLPDDELTLQKFKVIVLMVLWKLDQGVDALLVEELLTLDDQDEDADDNEIGIDHHQLM